MELEGWRCHDRQNQNLILPKVGKLCQQQSDYLDRHFKTQNDVSSSSSSFSCLLSELTKHCADFQTCLQHLHTTVNQRALSWISLSFRAKVSIANLNLTPFATVSHRMQSILGEELTQLAVQLHRVHNIRQYLETALFLEALVGDLEDAVFCSGHLRIGNMLTKLSTSLTSLDFGQKHERLLQAIKYMNDIEDIISNVEKSQQWHRLLQSVDHRVEKSLSALRADALAEHRALLVSLGWPPKLVTLNVESGRISELLNPLVLMNGDEKKSYAQSFHALCALQRVQRRREVRNFKSSGQKECDIQLWAMDELVSPIAERMEYHFLKWAEQPELIFALVYRVARDFVVGVSDILQPLIDAARLSSYSANEAWVSAMIHMLSGFLRKKVFPSLAEKYKEKDMKSEVISSWLHLVDLIAGFDKRMQSLIRSETCLFLLDAQGQGYGGLSRGVSVLIVFCDRPDWLKIWAKMELKDGWKKLKAVLKDAKAWHFDDKHRVNFHVNTVCETFLLSSGEDHKAPLVAESAVKIATEMIDRCHTLPFIWARVKFVRSTVASFFWYFSNVLLHHCKIAELSHDNLDESVLVRACQSISAARYVESRLHEWSDDVSFLEMNIAENREKDKGSDGDDCFFKEEIKCLSELETNWLIEVIAVLLRQFESLTLGYNRDEEYIDEDQNMTRKRDSTATELALFNVFLEALQALRNQLHVLKINLNPKDFLDLWRSVADGLDHFISGSIFESDVQFSRELTNQFETNMQALYLVFQPFCARPEAFFPCIRDTLKLLTMSKEGLKRLSVALSSKKSENKCSQIYGISHLSYDQVNKVLRNIKF